MNYKTRSSALLSVTQTQRHIFHYRSQDHTHLECNHFLFVLLYYVNDTLIDKHLALDFGMKQTVEEIEKTKACQTA